MWKLSLLVVPAALAARIQFTDSTFQAPRETGSKNDDLDLARTGMSPRPTSRPEFGMVDTLELLRRQDSYALPTDYCGWEKDYKSHSITCNQIGASCINVGTLRGCCSGSTTACVSTFYSVCVPYLSYTGACGPGSTCCSSAQNPECATGLFTSRADPSATFTWYDCEPPNQGGTYILQDYPPFLTTDASTLPSASPSTSPSSTSTSTSPTTTPSTTTPVPGPTSSTASPEPTPAPIGAIVGGVVGGVAVIAFAALGIFYIHRRTSRANAAAAGAGAAPPTGGYGGGGGGGQAPIMAEVPAQGQWGYGPSVAGGGGGAGAGGYYPGTSPDSYAAHGHGQQHHSPGAYSGPFHSPTGTGMTASPDKDIIVQGGGGVVQQYPVEAPAHNPVGSAGNRAELGTMQ
ncbi:hypothetical protein QBC46DRAFT_401239 [Diplogelasinospora grovesii]|uniref:Mid2 domain-containing protein n=1 Tax=Diplogelasinospora grovesii TaxID=303347 RepID=A0AAN6MVM4_9PEZI|nr:hypothetical protein QBC46DRAFT_401239 [Diplogelasinospora grovesii]